MAGTKVCRRCGGEFDDPVPPVTNPSPFAIKEIASSEWCSTCNVFAMVIMFRNSSAYLPESGKLEELRDPVRGGHKCR